MTSLTPGSRLGAFEILATLGEGGMGAVYRARDTRLNRDVAIKVLLPAIAGDPDRLARFGREAQVLASLNHPNIAAIYGLEDAGETKALVLELVDGPTLAERIERQGAEGKGPGLPFEEVISIARQIADAVGAAHEQGIVHRDLKPANIKLRPDGTVKVLDFGLAKPMDAVTPASASVTMFQSSPVSSPTISVTSPTISIAASMAGMIFGTAAYMSPEQASGKPVDKRADIWAFGVVVWEMLTGRRMFEGETIAHVLAAVLTKDPDLSAAPPRVRRMLERCLEKDPKKRLRDIGDAMTLVEDPAVQKGAPPARSLQRLLPWALTAALAVALGMTLRFRPGAPVATIESPIVRLPIQRGSLGPYVDAARAFAVSPDGRFLAYYTLGSSGRSTLSVQTLATGERREVSGSTVLVPVAPFWSPDSRQIAYAAIVAASVFDIVTGTTRELCSCRFQGGSWNRDGVILIGAPGSADPQPIRRLSLESRTPIPVTTVDAAKGEYDNLPVFLPDGQRFLFTRTRAGSIVATFMGRLGSDKVQRVTDGSRSLVATLGGSSDSYLLGIDTAGLVAQAFDMDAGSATGQPTIISAGAAAASVSTNGVLATSMPFSRPVVQLTWFDRGGSRIGVIGSPDTIQAVALAPDGRTVAVVESGSPGTGTTLSVRDANGTNRRLGSSVGGDAPVWSPDGKRIVSSSRLDNAVSFYERAADGSGQTTRFVPTEQRRSYANDWSRDGHWLIYTAPKKEEGVGDLDLDLWVIHADPGADRTPVPYLTSTAREAQAEFSPDGRFVAYTSIVGSGEPEVYVQPFPHPSEGKWLVSNGSGSEPHWSRDGRELFYFAGQALMSVQVTLQPTFKYEPPVKLFDAPVQPWYINDSDRSQVALDGKHFLLLAPAGATNAPPIDVVVNWRSLLGK